MSSRVPRQAALALLAITTAVFGLARADEPATITVTIKDHRFTPSEIHVPAGQDVALDIQNQDAAAEEFDLRTLGLQEVIAANDSGVVWLRETKQGRYPFFGDYHSGTARGEVVVE